MLIKEKENVRNWARSERSRLDLGQLANLLVFNIENFNIYKNSQIVMLYHPMPNEINLLPLLNDKKNFCFPRVIDGKIIPYYDGKAYTKGAYGIMEPFETQEVETDKIDLIIVPALAIDRKGNRLGYGKGYYDRFLNNIDRAKTTIISALPKSLFVERIDSEPQDIPIDYLITEKNIYKF